MSVKFSKAEQEENRQLQQRAKYLRELLKEFGLNLYGFDPGVTAFWPEHPKLPCHDPWNGPIKFDGAEWKWLEPLLIELRDRRRGTYNTPEADSIPVEPKPGDRRRKR